MKRRIMLLTIALMFLFALNASGVEARVATVTPNLTFDGTTAKCSVAIVDSGKKINATITLWYGNSKVGSWSGSEQSVLSLSGECAVVKGREYTLKVSGTSDGVSFQSTPLTKTCP